MTTRSGLFRRLSSAILSTLGLEKDQGQQREDWRTGLKGGVNGGSFNMPRRKSWPAVLDSASPISGQAQKDTLRRSPTAAFLHPSSSASAGSGNALEILEQIGEGTCGKVFRARFHGHLVAVKQIKSVEEYEIQGTCPVDASETIKRSSFLCIV
jgi:hypothetical protein